MFALIIFGRGASVARPTAIARCRGGGQHRQSARRGKSQASSQALCANSNGGGSGTSLPGRRSLSSNKHRTGSQIMNQIIYLVGLVVIVVAILSFLGLG